MTRKPKRRRIRNGTYHVRVWPAVQTLLTLTAQATVSSTEFVAYMFRNRSGIQAYRRMDTKIDIAGHGYQVGVEILSNTHTR